MYSTRENACGTTKVYWVYNAGKEERGVGGATIIQATYQSGRSADLIDVRLFTVTTIKDLLQAY